MVEPLTVKVPEEIIGTGPQLRSKTVVIVKVFPPAIVKPVKGCINRGILILLPNVTVFDVPFMITQPVPVQLNDVILGFDTDIFPFSIIFPEVNAIRVFISTPVLEKSPLIVRLYKPAVIKL